MVDDKSFMSESRDRPCHIFDKHTKDPANDHWYPKDPVGRTEVDKWMDWSKPLHLCIEAKAILTGVGAFNSCLSFSRWLCGVQIRPDQGNALERHIWLYSSPCSSPWRGQDNDGMPERAHRLRRVEIR